MNKPFINRKKSYSWVSIFIEVHQGEEYSLKACKFRKDKNSELEFFDNIESLVKRFGDKHLYAIHVNGTGVLTRKVDFLPNFREQLIISGDKDDFYFSSYNDSSEVIVSFFRKKVIEEIIIFFESKKLFLINISCGIIPILNLIKEDKRYSIFDFQLEIRNGKIHSFEKRNNENNTLAINDEFISKSEAISKGINQNLLLIEDNESNALSGEILKKCVREFKEYSKFKIGGLTFLATLLIALVFNYFFTNSLNNDIAQLELELTLNNDNLSLLDRLNQEKQRKALLVSTSGVNQKEFISFYINKIVESTPNKIIFKELSLFPLIAPLKEKRKVETNNELIELIGYTPNSEILEDWMDNINRFSWIKSVKLVNYLQTNKGYSEFKFTIELAQ